MNNGRTSICFTSDPARLCEVRKCVREFLSATHLCEMDAELIVLAIDEACTNVIRHAYAGAQGQPVELAMELAGDRLTARIRDYGKCCAGRRFRGRQLEKVRPGGVGMHIMRKAFDSVEYHPRERGTELIMTRRCRAAQGAPVSPSHHTSQTPP